MKPVYLTDQEIKDQLYPFTQTRSAADIRVGILTIREKWEALLKQPVTVVEPGQQVNETDAQVFAANIIPSETFVNSLISQGPLTASNPDYSSVKIIQHPWHIFEWNDWAIREDFRLITQKRLSQHIPESVQAINPREIFIEEGAKLHHWLLNASHGPIYIGKNAEVMEGSTIRGPFALCEGAVVKMGSKIYGATTIGPYSIAAGEIKNIVMFGYSNKSHDGYLGDAVLGEWCNLGAGTTASNVKNNATEVRVWHRPSNNYIKAGIKCGLLMGDYSRAAINTGFNTGSVVGVCVNVFGEGTPSKYLPDFTWGNKGQEKYQFEKALSDIANWKKFKNRELTEKEIQQLKHIFEQS